MLAVHIVFGAQMPKPDYNQNRPAARHFDVEDHHHVDQAGNLWSLGLVLSIRDGVLCLKELAIRPVGHNEQLTSAVLRGINVRDLVSHERRHLIEEGHLAPDSQDDRTLSEAQVEELLASRGPAVGRRLDEFDLRLVAHLYASAYEAGLPVQRTVAERLGVSIPTASRRISLARQSGLLDRRYTQTRGRRSPSKENSDGC